MPSSRGRSGHEEAFAPFSLVVAAQAPGPSSLQSTEYSVHFYSVCAVRTRACRLGQCAVSFSVHARRSTPPRPTTPGPFYSVEHMNARVGEAVQDMPVKQG